MYAEGARVTVVTHDADCKRGWAFPANRKHIEKDPDPVNSPPHYTNTGIPGVELIDLIEHLNFCRGGAIKYIFRAGVKDPAKEIQDLKKAVWMVQREIARLEKKKT